MSKNPISIFLFHRDLRIIDNLALNELVKVSKNIVPIFVFTPEQTSKTKNEYYNSNSIQFMVESIESLKNITNNKLQLFYGKLTTVIDNIFDKNDVEYIAFNQDYTPYAKERTEDVLKLTEKYGVQSIIEEDYTLVKMEDVREGNYYSVFKPYLLRMSKKKILKPTSKKIKFSSVKLKGPKPYKQYHKLYTQNDDLFVEGERKQAVNILKNIKDFKKYNTTRNQPVINTTLLSAHIKFGTVSVREVYYSFKRLGPKNELVRQLWWKDFYAQLMYYLPSKNTIGGGNFQNKKIKWGTSQKLFKSWSDGKTGFPIVDAAMRQLKIHGWVHNRCRLIVSNFLSLIMNINWKKGEKLYAQHLVDYDVSSNNLNWQWSSNVGTDRTSYLRIYNPFNQSKEVDKDCEYIKEYLPELEDVPNKDIHNWNKTWQEYKGDIDYPKPIFDFSKRYQEAKERYKK
jgi:deoxyribodipyrimidine photo-lyase